MDDKPALLISHGSSSREKGYLRRLCFVRTGALITLNKGENEVHMRLLMAELDGMGFIRTVKTLGYEIPIIIFTKGREEVVIDA